MAWQSWTLEVIVLYLSFELILYYWFLSLHLLLLLLLTLSTRTRKVSEETLKCRFKAKHIKQRCLLHLLLLDIGSYLACSLNHLLAANDSLCLIRPGMILRCILTLRFILVVCIASLFSSIIKMRPVITIVWLCSSSCSNWAER